MLENQKQAQLRGYIDQIRMIKEAVKIGKVKGEVSAAMDQG